ncbi:hypothetical protein [Paracoccus beibuensis]|uniref:hypothetical protein n=1 Tax=Paracoccus beibuensis TaxID=547602 RepID=UPI00224039B0|nr:hypothetical protein [Paracoccus beibuensis]
MDRSLEHGGALHQRAWRHSTILRMVGAIISAVFGFLSVMFVMPYHTHHAPSCHSVLTNGRIQLLNGCTHTLAG